MGRPKGSKNSIKTGTQMETNPYTQQIQETAEEVNLPSGTNSSRRQAAPQLQIEEDDVPQSQTLRKVEVLSNLANACRNKEVVRALKALPDGQIILSIFTEAIQSKINQIMTGKEEQQTIGATEIIRDNVDSVLNMASSLEKIMVHMHQSPLIQVLQALTTNLSKPRAPEQPQYPPQYSQQQPPQQLQPQGQPAPMAPSPGTPPGVTPYYESQIEQTPKFTQSRKQNSPAPTSPPRGDGFNSW